MQIARALDDRPSFMLLDEPAAGLDLGGREDLVRRLGELAADHGAPAMVLVTHHVEEVPPHFTDVLLVRDGRVVAQGPIEITLTAANLEATFGLPLELRGPGEPVCRPRPLTPQGTACDALPTLSAHLREGPLAMDWLIDNCGLPGWARDRAGRHRGRHRRLRLPHVRRRGAAAGAVAAALGAPFPLQVVVAVAVALLLLLIVRPMIRRQFMDSETDHQIGTSALVGREARVLQAVTDTDGRIKLATRPGPRAWPRAASPSALARRSALTPSTGRRPSSPRSPHTPPTDPRPGASRKADPCPTGIISLIVLLLLAGFVIIVLVRTVRVVPQQTALIIERLGRYSRTLEAACTSSCRSSTRARTSTCASRSCPSRRSRITSDNLVVSIDTVIYYQVIDPKSAVYEIANFIQGIEQLTVTTLRNVGLLDLEQTLTSRDQDQRPVARGARRGDRQVGHPRQPRRGSPRPSTRRTPSRSRWRSR